MLFSAYHNFSNEFVQMIACAIVHTMFITSAEDLQLKIWGGAGSLGDRRFIFPCASLHQQYYSSNLAILVKDITLMIAISAGLFVTITDVINQYMVLGERATGVQCSFP